jgi:multiple sugar transport system ATP-binding protein
MDEPLSNLDAKLRVQARAEISKLHQRLETTFIYVTHDQVEAMTMGTRIAVLNDGILQQIDTPQNLYDYPSNIFVAGFIGSPSMNFFDGELTERDGKVAVETDRFVLDIPEDREDTYRPHLGIDIVLGVRPEDIHDPDFAPPDISQQLVEAQVDVTELMGDEVVVYLQKEDTEFLGRFDPRTDAKVGKTMSAAFNMDRMHIFNRTTEKAIR